MYFRFGEKVEFRKSGISNGTIGVAEIMAFIFFVNDAPKLLAS